MVGRIREGIHIDGISARGGGADLLVLMTVHMNNNIAKKAIQEGGTSFKLFLDEIAVLIVKHGVRTLSGDWNMAMWKVAGELLARGIHANLAAWFPFQMALESVPRIDGEAIFIIGPSSGVRMIFDSSILVRGPPLRPEKWREVESIVPDNAGKELRREPFGLFQCKGKGQG